jgi:hypothetical protein
MKDDSEAHAGGCLCGGVRYHLQGDALWVAHCHCQSCRRHTGTAMTTFVGVLKPQFKIVNGAAKTFQSSTGVWRRFCPNCGTPLTYEAAYCPEETHVYLATLDAHETFQPTLHVYHSEAMPWLHVADDLPRYETTSRNQADQNGPDP